MSSSSVLFLLDSRDNTQNGADPADSEFLISLDPVQFRRNSVALESISFANTLTPVNALNNVIEVQEDDGASTISVALPEQSYTGSQLATEIASLLTAASSAGITYTASFSSQTLKLTVDADILNFRYTTNTTASRVLGLASSQLGTNYATSITGSTTVRLDGLAWVDVCTSLNTRNVSSSSAQFRILERIHIDVPFGAVFTYKSGHSTGCLFFDNEVDSIQIQLRDETGRILPLPEGNDVCTVLRMYIE